MTRVGSNPNVGFTVSLFNLNTDSRLQKGNHNENHGDIVNQIRKTGIGEKETCY